MQAQVIKWFPFFIFLSTMMMPHLLKFSAESKTCIPIMFLIWLLLISIEHPLNIPKKGIYLLTSLVIGQSYIWVSGNLNMAEPMLLGLLWITIAFFLLNNMQHITKYMDTILLSYLAVAVIWAILAGIVWFYFTGGGAISIHGIALTHSAQEKPTGPFSNGNVFGIMMLCAWIISIKFGLNFQKYRIPFFVLAFFFLVWVFASTSRGAWVAGSIVALGLIFRLLLAKKWTYLFYLLFSLLVSWFLAGEMVLVATGDNNLADKAENLISASARLVLYPGVFEIWKDNGLFGVGLGNLVGHYLTGQAEALSYLPEGMEGMGATASAHNHLLHMMAEAGLIGLIVWGTVAFILFRCLMKNRFDYQSSAWSPLSIALVLWIQGLFNLTMTEALPFFLFFMMLGLAIAFDRTIENKNTVRIPSLYFILAAMLILFTLIYYSINTYKSWKLYEQMIYTEQGGARGKLINKLFNLNTKNIYPFVMITVVQDFMETKKDDVQVWVSMLPNIEYALSREEWPHLYQAQFYTYMISEDWDKACASGKFLQQQHWPNDANIEAYKKSCLGEKADDFKLGW